MKKNLIIATIALMLSSYAAAESIRSDCDEQIQGALSALEGGYSYAADGKSLVIDTATAPVPVTNVKVVKSGPENGGGEGSQWVQYSASVGNKAGLHGKVLVTATRGGCLVNKVNLQD